MTRRGFLTGVGILIVLTVLMPEAKKELILPKVEPVVIEIEKPTPEPKVIPEIKEPEELPIVIPEPKPTPPKPKPARLSAFSCAPHVESETGSLYNTDNQAWICSSCVIGNRVERHPRSRQPKDKFNKA